MLYYVVISIGKNGLLQMKSKQLTRWVARLTKYEGSLGVPSC